MVEQNCIAPQLQEQDPLDKIVRIWRDNIKNLEWQLDTIPFRVKGAPACVKASREVMLLAVEQDGDVLEYVADALKNDREVVLTAVRSKGKALEYASASLRADREVVLEAFETDFMSLHYAAREVFEENDMELVKKMFKMQGVQLDGTESVDDLFQKAIQLPGDDDFALHAGNNLHFAPAHLRSKKEVVLMAAGRTSESLKYAMNGLNQDPDCLKMAGLWDQEDHKSYARKEEASLSVKFSLAEGSTPYATQFALAMKNHDFFGQFKTYNPNAFCKKSCDPKYTDINYPCRGTLATCTLPPSQNLTAAGKPCNTSCWRVSFRYHQEACKASGGFMIQVEEAGGLGAGQVIETVMAEEAGLKVFRTYTNMEEWDDGYMPRVARTVEKWYATGCSNMKLEHVFVGCTGFDYEERE